MKERPIIFSGPMVRALLARAKTQTRRVVKPPNWMGDRQPNIDHHTIKPFRAEGGWHFGAIWKGVECPYGQPGDRLWVRETHKPHCTEELGTCVQYRADEACIKPTEWSHHEGALWEMNEMTTKWRPSIYMPRFASRLTLEIVSVRVERMQDITEEDARAEGCDSGICHQEAGVLAGETDPEDIATFRDGYGFLWESINGPGSWDKNPWVWVIEFKKL